MVFEIGVLLITAALLLLLYKLDKNTLKIYGLTFLGVLLFEYFTQALWLNNGLARWAYLYLDISWIITLGWTTIIVTSRKLVELYQQGRNDKIQFLLTIIIAGFIGFVAEWAVLKMNIREYSQAVINTASGITIGPVPIEAIYYIPVFMILVLSFSKYWEQQLKISKGKKQ